MSLLSLLADLSFICLPRSEKERDGIRRRHFLTPTFLAKFTGKKTFNFIVKQKNIIQWERWQGFLPKLKRFRSLYVVQYTLSSFPVKYWRQNPEKDAAHKNSSIRKVKSPRQWKLSWKQGFLTFRFFSSFFNLIYTMVGTKHQTPRDQKKWVKRSDKNLLLSLEIFPMCTSSEPRLGKSW